MFKGLGDRFPSRQGAPVIGPAGKPDTGEILECGSSDLRLDLGGKAPNGHFVTDATAATPG